MISGKLIAIEGIDGSGKGTQSELLFKALESQNVAVEIFHFPQYESTFFGGEVGRYLHGDYGQLSDVNPKFSALLYALDRFESRNKLMAALQKGKVVICDRYTSSNTAHQSARTETEQRQSMIDWIEHVEHSILGLPKPDLVIFLDSTVSSSQTLVGNKQKRAYTNKSHDIQESSHDHLHHALEQFRNLAKSNEWKVIQSLNADGILRAALDIHREVLAHINETFA